MKTKSKLNKIERMPQLNFQIDEAEKRKVKAAVAISGESLQDWCAKVIVEAAERTLAKSSFNPAHIQQCELPLAA